MPVVVSMRWWGMTPPQCEAARGAVGWERDAPEGLLLHVASFDEDALFVTSVWERADPFNDFLASRLMPGLRQVGFVGEPEIVIRPAHALFTPAYDVALPGEHRGISKRAAD